MRLGIGELELFALGVGVSVVFKVALRTRLLDSARVFLQLALAGGLR